MERYEQKVSSLYDQISWKCWSRSGLMDFRWRLQFRWFFVDWQCCLFVCLSMFLFLPGRGVKRVVLLPDLTKHRHFQINMYSETRARAHFTRGADGDAGCPGDCARKTCARHRPFGQEMCAAPSWRGWQTNFSYHLLRSSLLHCFPPFPNPLPLSPFCFKVH